jgi:predicted histone-like DNA-binding protein
MIFKKWKKKITTGYTPGEKYVAKIVKGETIPFKRMAEMMVTSSTVSKGDTLNVLDSLVTQTLFMLESGHSVKFDGLGTFYPKAKVRAMATADEVTAETIGTIGIGFLAEIDAREKMNKTSISIMPLDEPVIVP